MSIALDGVPGPAHKPASGVHKFPELAVVTLARHQMLDTSLALPVVVPVHKVCKPQKGCDVYAQLLGYLSHALPRRVTHPPPQISFHRLVVTTHCSAPSSPLVGGTSQVGEASSFLAEGASAALVTSGQRSRRAARDAP